MSNLPNPQLLADSYRLPQPIEVEALERDVYLVRSEPAEYALKVYGQGASLDQQRYEHWLMLALSSFDLSFELPRPIRNHQGATFFTTPEGEIWVLSPRLYGQQVQPNDPDHAYAVGAALAELHKVLALIQPLLRPDFMDYNPEERTLLHLRGRLPIETEALGLPNTPEGIHRLRRFLILAKQFQVPPPLNDQLHWHIIHGDFFGTNLLYNGERVTGVLDFKFARPDYRAREFAETLMRVANDLGPLFWGTARAFVEGYASMLSLTRAEIDVTPRFMVEYQVDRIMYYAYSQPQRAAEALRIQEDISAWLEIEQPRLLAMLRGVFLGE